MNEHVFKELIAAPDLARFSPTKTGELTIAPVLKGKLHPLMQLHAGGSFTRPSQIFVDAIFRVRISAISCGSVTGLQSEGTQYTEWELAAELGDRARTMASPWPFRRCQSS
jgi:hypothetical protein